MFGLEKCGSESKLHFVFGHKNLKNKTVEEKDTEEHSVIEDYFTTEQDPTSTDS